MPRTNYFLNVQMKNFFLGNIIIISFVNDYDGDDDDDDDDYDDDDYVDEYVLHQQNCLKYQINSDYSKNRCRDLKKK